MMSRLQAEEVMEAATAAALGAGTMPKGEASRVLRELQQRAAPDEAAARRRPHPAMLAAIGIEVVDG